MTNNITYSIFLFCMISASLYSQSTPNDYQEKTTAALNEYFKMDRENIHLHLNKDTFLTDEDVWFKGYIIEKKTNIPYVITSNVYISLIDANGNKILTQLYFAENSVFDGKIKLNTKLTSGKYYLQVYTNYMNNFSEDESSVYEITVINPTENNYVDTKIINYKDLEIDFYPESGTFLEGVSNTLGVKIVDCNNNGILLKDAEVIDSKGNLVTTFSTNQFGYGRLDILYTNNDVYKAILNIKGEKIEKSLPNPSLEGISYSINNYTFKDKTTIKLKTNSKTLKTIKNLPQTIVIQHNNASAYISYSFTENETEHLINIPSEKLFEGLNIVHLISPNGDKIGERVIYKPFQINENVELIVAQKRNDSIVINATSSMALSNLSISVLPSETFSEIPSKSIYNALQFDNFLSEKSKNMAYYLNDLTRTKQYELDNYLLTQKSIYNWNAMLKNPPQKKYEFDSGLTIKGTVNNSLNNAESHKIIMNSIVMGLNETTGINAKNEFVFENVFVLDSLPIYFSLLNKKSNKMTLNLYCQILNNNKTFFKPFIPKNKKCTFPQSDIRHTNYTFPIIRNAIIIDSITIVSKAKKAKLNNESRFSNNMSNGYKIDEKIAGSFLDLLGFIRAHGYIVGNEGGNVQILTSRFTSFSANRSPAIYLDDSPVYDFNFLQGYSLSDIDEIYINKHGYGGGSSGSNGIIRIYTKISAGIVSNTFKSKSKPFTFKNAFQPSVSYENSHYGNIHDEGFLKFGTIYWIPSVNTNENGTFSFSFPNLNQKTVKVVIEGISSEGNLISTTKTVTLD